MAAYRADLINLDGSIFRAIDLVCPGDHVAKRMCRTGLLLTPKGAT
jgi:hypothetical protein